MIIFIMTLKYDFKSHFDFIKKYDTNTKKINLSNKNIEGVLDLIEFKNLEDLDCSNNEITEIINIPDSLTYLDCSSNKIKDLCNLPISYKCINSTDGTISITSGLIYLNCSKNNISKLGHLPNNLSGVNCKSNPLTELYYPFNVKPKK